MQIVKAYLQMYTALRTHKFYKDATLLMAFERNLGHEAEWVDFIFRMYNHVFENYYFLRDTPDIVGILTTPLSRIAADDVLQELVHSYGLAVARDVISVNPDPLRAGDAAIRLLFDQMEAMQEYTDVRENRITRRITSTETVDRKRLSNAHDDLQRALSLGLHTARLFAARKLPVDYPLIESMRGARRHTAAGVQTLSATQTIGRKRAL